MQSRIHQRFISLVFVLIVVVRAKSIDRPPQSDSHSKLLVQSLSSSNGIGGNSADSTRVLLSKPIVNYTDSEANQIDAPSELGKMTEKPDYVNAFATVRSDLNAVKDNLKFLGKTQQMLLETFKTFELHEPEVSQPSDQQQQSASQSSKSIRPQAPQFNPFSSPPPTYPVASPTHVAPASTYAEPPTECQNYPNDHPQCTYPPAAQQYYNNQPYPISYPNYAPPTLPAFPYGSVVKEETNVFKTIPAPQRSQPQPQQPAPPIKTHQRLLPSLVPSNDLHIPSIAQITAKAAIAADLQRLRQLRAERQFQRHSRAQLMLWRRNNDQQAQQRTMSFLQQGLVQAFWTIVTVICVQMAPFVLLVIKLLIKSFLPALIGGGGDQQRFLAGPFDLDVGPASAFGGTRFGVSDDSFALNRFVQGGFGESQFGGTDDRLNEHISRDENELLDGDLEPDSDNRLDHVDEEDEVTGKQTTAQRRRMARLRNINVFR